jgi:hypothetical protein
MNNLAIRHEVTDKTCLFCDKPESIQHLSFECFIVKQPWYEFADTLDCKPAWRSERVHLLLIRNLRNNLCFRGNSALDLGCCDQTCPSTHGGRLCRQSTHRCWTVSAPCKDNEGRSTSDSLAGSKMEA